MTAFVATTATQMEVPTWVWYITVGLLLALLFFDVFIIGRPHEPSTRESAALAFYVSLAVVFGLGVWFFSGGGEYAGEFFAGWLTEYSLSVDNLFVFLIIMARFPVPRKYQQEACWSASSWRWSSAASSSPLGAAAINAVLAGSSTCSARSSSTPR